MAPSMALLSCDFSAKHCAVEAIISLEAIAVAEKESKLYVSSCCIVIRTNCWGNDSEVLISASFSDSTSALACQPASVVGTLLAALVNSECVFGGEDSKDPIVFMPVF